MSQFRKLHSFGKSKTMYYGDRPGEMIMKFMDSVSSYTQNKNERIEGTGVLRARISAQIFGLLEKSGIRTHFIDLIGDGEMLVKRVDMIKVEVIPRNYAAGSIVRNFPFQRGHKFEPPILKLDFKYENDPMLNTDYAVALGVATREELNQIRELAFRVNEILSTVLYEKGLILVDFKFEVGRDEAGQLVVADEISPDGMRLWDRETKQSLDKDVFRYDLGDLVAAYAEVQQRILT